MAKFEWDDVKASANLGKRQVSFEEGKTVFNDPFLMTFPDPDHSDGEQRYLNIGRSAKERILVVIHAEREASVRMISCRKATASERRGYEQENS